MFIIDCFLLFIITKHFPAVAPSHLSGDGSKSKQLSANGSSYNGSTTNRNVLTFLEISQELGKSESISKAHKRQNIISSWQNNIKSAVCYLTQLDAVNVEDDNDNIDDDDNIDNDDDDDDRTVAALDLVYSQYGGEARLILTFATTIANTKI